jgi:opacity protein-like surface antigen
MNKFALALAASVLTAAAAFAEETAAPVADEAASAAPEVVDADANGTFSLVEVQAVYPNVTEETFAAVDTDASGELSAEELAAAVEAGAFAA